MKNSFMHLCLQPINIHLFKGKRHIFLSKLSLSIYLLFIGLLACEEPPPPKDLSTKPASVGDLSIDGDIGTSSVRLIWTDAPDFGTLKDGSSAGSSIPPYKLLISLKGGSFSDISPPVTISFGPNNRSSNVESLVSDTDYEFKVVSLSNHPDTTYSSQKSKSVSVSTVSASSPPTAVTDLSHDGGTFTSINLSWVHDEDFGKNSKNDSESPHMDTPYEFEISIDSTDFLSLGPYGFEADYDNKIATISNLSSASVYYFKIYAINSSGAKSDPFTGGPFITNLPPAAVTDLSRDSGTSTSITLSWVHDGDFGKNGEGEAEVQHADTPYEFEMSTDNITFSSIPLENFTPIYKDKTMTISNLSSASVYYFKIYAVNLSGAKSEPFTGGPFVANLSSAPDSPTLEAIPGEVKPGDQTSTGVSFRVTPDYRETSNLGKNIDGEPSQPHSDLLRYKYRLKELGEDFISLTDGGDQNGPKLIETQMDQTATLSDLFYNTEYEFLVEVYNTNTEGNVSSSEIITITTGNPSLSPSPPSDLASSDITATDVTLDWAHTDFGTTSTGVKAGHHATKPYVISYSEDLGVTFAEVSYSQTNDGVYALVDVDVSSAQIKGLTQGTSYHFKVKAINEEDSSSLYSDVLEVITLLPGVVAPPDAHDAPMVSTKTLPTYTTITLDIPAFSAFGRLSDGTAITKGTRALWMSINGADFVPAPAGQVTDLTFSL